MREPTKTPPTARLSHLRAALSASASGTARLASDRASALDGFRVGMIARQFGKTFTAAALRQAAETAELEAEVFAAYPDFVATLDDRLSDMAAERRGTPGLEDALRYTRIEALREAVKEIRKEISP